MPLAYIMFLEDSGNRPDQGLPGVPGHPAHPIAPGGRPPGIWGGGNEPFPTPPIVIPPDAIAPGVPSHPIVIPGHPSHPIVIPPGSLAPGVPTHPIYLPPTIWPSPGHPDQGLPDSGNRPMPPIYYPPYPDQGLPPFPAHPIVVPPLPAIGEDEAFVLVVTQEGAKWAVVSTGKPTNPIAPTPEPKA
jgi:hypothetical protein